MITEWLCLDGLNKCGVADNEWTEGHAILSRLSAFCDVDNDCYGDDGYCKVGRDPLDHTWSSGTEQTSGCVQEPVFKSGKKVSADLVFKPARTTH